MGRGFALGDWGEGEDGRKIREEGGWDESDCFNIRMLDVRSFALCLGTKSV